MLYDLQKEHKAISKRYQEKNAEWTRLYETDKVRFKVRLDELAEEIWTLYDKMGKLEKLIDAELR